MDELGRRKHAGQDRELLELGGEPQILQLYLRAVLSKRYVLRVRGLSSVPGRIAGMLFLA